MYVCIYIYIDIYVCVYIYIYIMCNGSGDREGLSRTEDKRQRKQQRHHRQQTTAKRRLKPCKLLYVSLSLYVYIYIYIYMIRTHIIILLIIIIYECAICRARSTRRPRHGREIEAGCILYTILYYAMLCFTIL